MADAFFLSVEDLEFRRKIQEYQELTGKSIGEVLREQAKQLAKRLQDNTYPKSASQGKKRVSIDIGKVFLTNEWFEETFAFKNEKLGERVKDLVRAKNQGDLEPIFQNSTRLRKLHIEPFDANRHREARKDGRVSYKQPYSFPLTDQSKVKQYIAKEKKNVGTAKAGWARCNQLLGGTIPSWLTKDGTGEIDDQSAREDKPYITLTNKVSYFEALDRKGSIVSRSLSGRADTMIKAAKRALERAAKEAGLQ